MNDMDGMGRSIIMQVQVTNDFHVVSFICVVTFADGKVAVI